MTNLSKLLEPVEVQFYTSAMDEDVLNTLSVVFGYHPDNENLDVNELIIKPPFKDDNDQAVAWYGQDVIDNLIQMGWNPDVHGYVIELVHD